MLAKNGSVSQLSICNSDYHLLNRETGMKITRFLAGACLGLAWRLLGVTDDRFRGGGLLVLDSEWIVD